VIYRDGQPVVFGESCPSNPPPPPGYTVWKGPVPQELTQWAIALRDRISQFPYGTTWTTFWGGTSVLARKDHHNWHYLPDGTLLTDLCWAGITLYQPQSPSSGLGAVDPALATPDPSIAFYSISATQPPERTDWGLVAICACALATVAGGFVWGLRAAGR
jgi:hypothetical protein